MRPYPRPLSLLFALLVLLYAAPRDHMLWAQNPAPQLKFTRISTQQGLSQSTILCILQDHKGFMWFGSYNGLNRYDGYDVKVFKTTPGDSAGLSHNVVTALCEDPAGNGRSLWVGTEGGLNKLDLETETFTQYKADPDTPGSLSHDRIKSLFMDHGGTLWVGTDGGGLNRYVREENRFVHYTHEPGNEKSIGNNHIRCFYEDPAEKNILWIGTDGGLNRFDRETDTFTHFVHEPGNPHSLSFDNVTTLCGDRQGNLWVGTWQMGLNRLDRNTGRFTRYLHDPAVPAGLGHNIIRALYQDGAGNLWIGTFGGGLDRFDAERETFVHYRSSPQNPDSLGSDRIWCITEDRSGMIWVGTDFGGVNSFYREQKPFKLYKADPRAPGGLNSNNITAIRRAPGNETEEDTYWIGTLGGGLKKFDRRSNNYTHFLHDSKDRCCISNDTIRTIYADPADNGKILWLGTEGGLNKMDVETGRFTAFRADPANSHCLSNNNVYAICKGPGQTLWIGTFYGGLNRFDRETGRFEHFVKDPANPRGINDDIVWCLLKDSNGTLWIGTDRGGLNRYNQTDGTFTHYTANPGKPGGLNSNKILTLMEDRSGGLWLGTTNGLSHFAPSKDRFTSYGAGGVPAGNAIHSILDDPDGNLWLGTLKGLIKFDTNKQDFTTYSVADGLQDNEFNINACARGPGGEMFFGGIRGFNAFVPGDIRENPHLPPIVVTGFQVFNRPVPVGPRPDGPALLRKSITYTHQLELLYRDNVFSFQFAALDYVSPGENQYAYMMEGFEPDWNTVGNRRFVTYTGLPPGCYTFKVKGSNNDGVWNEEGAALTVVVVPPFWKTWWFYLMSGVLLLALGAVGGRLGMKYFFLFSFWKQERYVGQYRLLERIGGGGMGTVYKAHYLRDKTKIVAIKVLKEELFRDPRSKLRFKQEAAIVDQLEHPNIVKIIERGEHQQKLYIVMEYLEGRTLEQELKAKRMIASECALDIMIQAANALRWIHRQDVIHRDIKSENIILTPGEDDECRVKILDFGLARTKFKARLTETGILVGTVAYLAPEQIARAEFLPAGDVHAMGIIFYEILTGEHPYTGETATEIMRKILEQLPLPPSQLIPGTPPSLDGLIMSMLTKNPKERPDAGTIYDELTGIKFYMEN